MGELRDSLTNSQLTYYMALFELYPMGDEAMDVRFSMLIAVLQSGLATVQVKRGRRARLRDIFKRDFWTRPCSVVELKSKLIAVFKGHGMKTEDDDNVK